MTMNHRRRIICKINGHPARFNDETLGLFDGFVNKVKDGTFNKKYCFTLCDFTKDYNVINVKYKGCYVIVNNEYLNWSITVPRLKIQSRPEIRFSG